jgi:ComF family protein
MSFRPASIADALISTLFAPACLSCARVLDAPTRSPVCDPCWARIGRFVAPSCELGATMTHLDRVHAIGPLDNVLRDVIHALKFQQRRGLAARLGPLLRDVAGDLLGGADAVVPVPLHPWRQWRRGYNQAEMLAATLGRPIWLALRRTRATPPQTSLDRDARHANVRHAFALGGWLPGSAARTRRRVEGRTLVLVDDVLTTGATLDACARVLRQAGAREVHAVTVARA